MEIISLFPMYFRSHLQSYDVPIESSNLRDMDGKGDVVEDEWVDVVVPHNDKKIGRMSL